MKAIPLLQPWASLVVMGIKKIETRSEGRYAWILDDAIQYNDPIPARGTFGITLMKIWEMLFDKINIIKAGTILPAHKNYERKK